MQICYDLGCRKAETHLVRSPSSQRLVVCPSSSSLPPSLPFLLPFLFSNFAPPLFSPEKKDFFSFPLPSCVSGGGGGKGRWRCFKSEILLQGTVELGYCSSRDRFSRRNHYIAEFDCRYRVVSVCLCVRVAFKSGPSSPG